MSETELHPQAAPPVGMILVAAGAFLFGRDKAEVKLGAFWIDRDPVTNREYYDYVGKTGAARPSHWPPGVLPDALALLPVVHVSFEEASAYAKFHEKDLPTPVQWE